ncbi:hypothetical protein OQA88_6113 [Cercophora sp. LCS_1]
MNPDFTIVPANPGDIPVLAKISHDAFVGDAQTEMKSHGRTPFNMGEHMLQSLPDTIQSPKSTSRVIKVVQIETGLIMGFCIWGFRGVGPPVFPTEPALIDEESQLVDRAKSQRDTPSPETTTPGPGATEGHDPIQRLNDLTGKDFRDWMDKIMPEKARCMYVIGLYVSPAFQRQGVGSALLLWGTRLADSHGVFAWVHSSHGAWRVYERAGFKTARTLEVDLDEYAPVPAPLDRYEGGKWGKYVFRYMVYGNASDTDFS